MTNVNSEWDCMNSIILLNLNNSLSYGQELITNLFSRTLMGQNVIFYSDKSRIWCCFKL